jgi:hypothetical protein
MSPNEGRFCSIGERIRRTLDVAELIEVSVMKSLSLAGEAGRSEPKATEFNLLFTKRRRTVSAKKIRITGVAGIWRKAYRRKRRDKI